MLQVNPLTHSFVPIAFMLVMSTATGLGVLLLSWLAGGGTNSTAGDTTYECGFDPADSSARRFPVKFYGVAMLFILFDVEIALLYPWAVYFGGVADSPALKLFALMELLVFVALLTAGYIYLYKSGAFDWAKQARREPRAAGSGVSA